MMEDCNGMVSGDECLYHASDIFETACSYKRYSAELKKEGDELGAKKAESLAEQLDSAKDILLPQSLREGRHREQKNFAYLLRKPTTDLLF